MKQNMPFSYQNFPQGGQLVAANQSSNGTSGPSEATGTTVPSANETNAPSAGPTAIGQGFTTAALAGGIAGGIIGGILLGALVSYSFYRR
jgi:predicted lipid-binding transport protein (Tim44 family)